MLARLDHTVIKRDLDHGAWEIELLRSAVHLGREHWTHHARAKPVQWGADLVGGQQGQIRYRTGDLGFPFGADERLPLSRTALEGLDEPVPAPPDPERQSVAEQRAIWRIVVNSLKLAWGARVSRVACNGWCFAQLLEHACRSKGLELRLSAGDRPCVDCSLHRSVLEGVDSQDAGHSPIKGKFV
jgi:hypothetical protein